MKNLLTIGEFAKMCRLTVKTVRYYHEAGVLEPAFVDQDSGYRYYSHAQLMEAEKIRSRMLLQIHDELVFEAPQLEIPLLASLVEEEMSTAFTLDVPLKVDVKSGPNWEACEEL